MSKFNYKTGKIETMKTIKHDSEREIKWSQKRIIRSELDPYVDPGIDCSHEPSRTDQSQAQECDINFILKRYQQTGVLPGVNAQQMFMDVADAPSYHEAMNLVVRAQEQFESLDAFTRKRFGNDPAEFMEFMHDPKNAKELVELGLGTFAPPSDTDRVVEAINASRTPSPADPDSAGGQPAPKGSKK